MPLGDAKRALPSWLARLNVSRLDHGTLSVPRRAVKMASMRGLAMDCEEEEGFKSAFYCYCLLWEVLYTQEAPLLGQIDRSIFNPSSKRDGRSWVEGGGFAKKGSYIGDAIDGVVLEVSGSVNERFPHGPENVGKLVEWRDAVGNLIRGHTLFLKLVRWAVAHARDDGTGFGDIQGVHLSACGWLMMMMMRVISILTAISSNEVGIQGWKPTMLPCAFVKGSDWST